MSHSGHGQNSSADMLKGGRKEVKVRKSQGDNQLPELMKTEVPLFQVGFM